MKPTMVFAVLLACLITGQTIAQQGLKGEYYIGTNFERKVLIRIDPAINFNWSIGSPARGIPHSYYSIRWSGKLLAPVTGKYRFYANVDDGIRIWIGNQKVMESWQLNDSQKYTGSIVLEAGHYYDLRVDYFNDMMGGEIELFWQRPNARQLTQDRASPPGEPITAQYFFQKAPPIVVPKKQTPIVSAPPKVIPQKRPTVVKPIPGRKPPTPKSTAIATTKPVSPTATPQPLPDIKAGHTFILQNVQFEQSSYLLYPESSTELNKLVAAMKMNPLWQMEVAGHTDNIGDPRLNLALSENRAKVIANYLVRKGIDDSRITTKGYGGTRPIADNTVENERQKNRRVEITIR